MAEIHLSASFAIEFGEDKHGGFYGGIGIKVNTFKAETVWKEYTGEIMIKLDRLKKSKQCFLTPIR